MLKVVLGDLLGDLPGEKEGTKDVKIGIVSGNKSSPASEKGHIKCVGQYQVLRGIDNLMRETRNFSICVG